MGDVRECTLKFLDDTQMRVRIDVPDNRAAGQMDLESLGEGETETRWNSAKSSKGCLRTGKVLLKVQQAHQRATRMVSPAMRG